MGKGRKVWAYALELKPWGIRPGLVHRFEMPAQSRLLSLQLQDGTPMLWVQADPTAAFGFRSFVWVATGGDVPAGGEYVGTVQAGALAFHLFEASNEDGDS